MFITQHTLDKMSLCMTQERTAREFVGEKLYVTPGVVHRALEEGLDVTYFVDYWLREKAGEITDRGLMCGRVEPRLLGIYEGMWENLRRVERQDGAAGVIPGLREELRTASRSVIIFQAMEYLYRQKRWPD